MKPVSPVIKGFKKYEILVGEGQPQYLPIPSVVFEGEEKRVCSRWEFSDHERNEIARGGSLLYSQLTFGNLFQPMYFQIVEKEIDPPEQYECLCNGRGCVRCCGPS